MSRPTGIPSGGMIDVLVTEIQGIGGRSGAADVCSARPITVETNPIFSQHAISHTFPSMLLTFQPRAQRSASGLDSSRLDITETPQPPLTIPSKVAR